MNEEINYIEELEDGRTFIYYKDGTVDTLSEEESLEVFTIFLDEFPITDEPINQRGGND